MTKIEQILKNNGIKYYDSITQIYFTCPFCHREKHFYMNKYDGRWDCKKCGESGNFKRFLEFLNLNVKVEDIYNYVNKVKKCKSVLNSFVRENFTKDENIFSKYLINRGLDYVTIKSFFIKYCIEGFMRYRIVFPIVRNNIIKGYIGRTVDKNEDKKYKNTLFQKSLFLYNVDNIDLKPKKLVITEGIFDALSVFRKHKNVVSIFGKVISKYQYRTIIGLKPESIIVALDKDAIKNSFNVAKIFYDQGINTYILNYEKFNYKDFGDVKDKNEVEHILNEVKKYKIGLFA
jgi:ribosomal protein L37AE/L43A